MGRAIYPHDLSDADFSWLISTYREKNPHVVMVESPCLPVVLYEGIESKDLVLGEHEQSDALEGEAPTEEESDTEYPPKGS